MVKVVFVGDKPSKLNTDPNIAFVGTPSLKNLQKWIDELNLKANNIIMINSHTEMDWNNICLHRHYKDRVFVALGNNASKVLNILNIPHFKLPHPSPKNRLLNNKKFIKEQLIKCKEFINV